MNRKRKVYSNLFYHEHLLEIGGCEDYLYNLALKYSNDYDLTFVYNSGHEKQISRLKDVLGEDRVIKDDGKTIYHCDRFFTNYQYVRILNRIDAECIEVIHANFDVERRLTPHIDERFVKYLAVSKCTKEGWKKRTKIDAELCYNPLVITDEEQNEKVLLLISTTRLTIEKGKDRILALIKELHRQKRKFLWLIFTNDRDTIQDPNVIYMKPTLGIMPYVKKADYLIQLSDSEGLCYAIYKSLCVGTPVVVTRIPSVIKDLKVDNSNGIYLEFDCSNIKEVVNKMYDREFDFKYIPLEDQWSKYLATSKDRMEEIQMVKVKIKRRQGEKNAAKTLFLVKENLHIPYGNVVELTDERAKYLVSVGLAEFIEPISNHIDIKNVQAIPTESKPKAKRKPRKVKENKEEE